MKVFSWSGLVFVLSISFLWSCGYWLLLQTGSWQLLQQKNELTQQLDKANTLLQNWQQGYQLHLAYLATELREVQQLPVAGVESALVDPLQQLDEQIRRVLWPDPLLAYAVFDAQGRVQRLSSAEASFYFSQTNFQPAASATFLPPLVLKDQWILPLQVDQQQQRLVLWFDANQLQEQLQRLMATPLQTTEILLLAQDAEILSRSRFQKVLLPRLGLDNQDPQQALRIYAKRPPENLLRSKQRYQDVGAWPFTTLMTEINRQSSGFIASHYLNYLGRQTLASYRQLADWQLYLVVERDAGPMLEELAKTKMHLLAALIGLSLFLSVVFYLIHRQLQRTAVAARLPDEAQTQASQWLDPMEQGFEPPVLGTLDVEAIPVAQESAANTVLPPGTAPIEQDLATKIEPHLTLTVKDSEVPAPLQAAPPMGGAHLPAAGVPAAAILEAWLQQPNLDPQLADISRNWLQQVTPQVTSQLWCCDISLDVTRLLALRLQSDARFNYVLEASADFPQVLCIQKQRLLPVLHSLLTQTERRIGAGTLLIRLMLAETNQLRIEIVDQADSLTDGQWLTLLNGAPDDQSSNAVAYRQIQQQLSELNAHLSARADFAAGNKMVLTLPCEVPAQPGGTIASQFDGSAMLLCPPGESQQLYRRLLKQAGLDLLPMDDASQLLQWCESSPQELSKMLIDEDFVQSDAALAGKIAAVVRRYFPEVQVLLVVRQPQQWLEQAKAERLYILAKPLTPITLNQAFLASDSGLITHQRAQVWLCQPDPLLYWWIEQQLLSQHYHVKPMSLQSETPGDIQNDYYCLPWSQHDEIIAKGEFPAFGLWCGESAPQIQDNDQPFWVFSEGGAGLSQHLYQFTIKQQGSKTEMNP